MSEKILSNGLTHAQTVQALNDYYQQGGQVWNFPRVQHHLNIPYGTESVRQCIDIYVPKGEGPFPALVEVHGGGWWCGDRADGGIADATWALPFGYAVVSIGYRLVDEGIWPTQWNDITAALDKLMEVGPEYGIDTSRLCATGASAGTTLSLLLALKTKKYKCAIMCASILDFENMRKQFEKIGIVRNKRYAFPDEDWGIEGLLMGGSIYDVPEVWQDINVRNYVDADCPHILMYHGKLDKATPYLQTPEFAEFVREKTGDPERVRYKLMDDTGHSGGGYYAGWMAEEKLAFLRKYL